MKLRSFFSLAVVFFGFIAASPAFADNPPASHTQPAPKLYTKTYGSWVYRCVEATQPDGHKATSCQIFQNMGVKKDGHDISLAVLSFAKSTVHPGYDLSAMVPLGIVLPAGVSFSADYMSPITKQVEFCQAGGCVVAPQSASGLAEEFEQGKAGHLTFLLLNGHPFTINFSLDGFNDAIKALNSGALPQ